MAALWALARIRFADRPLPSNPIAPVLTQLAPPPVFDQLTSMINEGQARLTPWLIAIDTRSSSPSDARNPHSMAALRIDKETAVAILDESTTVDETDVSPSVRVITRDPASGLTVLGVTTANSTDSSFPPALPLARPRESSGFLLAADFSSVGVSVRPIFVGALDTVASPIWSGALWKLPQHIDVPPGSFLFSVDGALAGLVADGAGGLMLVPGEAIKANVDRLRDDPDREYGEVGIHVQPLAARTAEAAGAHVGVMVTSVDPRGPGAGRLAPTDVIEAIDGGWLFTIEHWRARVSRLAVGQTIGLRVKRRKEIRNIEITAAPRPAADVAQPLGLTMRSVPGAGVEVSGVTPGSAAALAGIQLRDLITVVGETQAPTPAQIRKAFTTSTGQPLLVVVTRGQANHVLAIETR
jgi:hypothetical protein